ncbi:hypothetical protein HMPREF9999_00267 [Alloprevotella sp. oral taxon 473 str. F0040]|nr:hypothetical protein HMPREF9999_00267 [Alloprevotella sp. oral taxon 473 str. F0040]
MALPQSLHFALFFPYTLDYLGDFQKVLGDFFKTLRLFLEKLRESCSYSRSLLEMSNEKKNILSETAVAFS